MTCKGICVRYKAQKPVGTGRYASGQRRCQICEIFIKWEGLWCPCCGYRLRTKPRNLKYKAKLRARVEADSIEAKTNAKSSKQKDVEFFKKFGKLFAEMKRNPGKAGGVEWDTMKKKTKGEKYYGAITSPLSYYVADQLNTKPKFIKALKEIVSKTGVKQMYLTFGLGEGNMTFNIRSFNDPNASFKFDIPSLSTLNPTSSKLGFSLTK